MKNEKDLKYRSINFDQGAGSYQRGIHSGDNANAQAARDIEKILGIYYDTLKWVQGSAIELDF